MKMVERCDYYSDDEYQQALQYEREEYELEQAMREYERECAEQEATK